MRIWLDPPKLKTFGLTVLQVEQAINNQNTQVASGQIGGPPRRPNQIFQFTVNTMGRLSDVTPIRETSSSKAKPRHRLAARSCELNSALHQAAPSSA